MRGRLGARSAGARFAVTCVAAALVAGCGAKEPVDSTGADVAANLKTISGLPQDGITLGDLDAPATLTVYDSLDSFNRGFFLSDLPELVEGYVRDGRVNIQVRTLTGFDTGQTLDAGGTDAARLAQGVGVQDHLWDFYGALSARYIGTIDTGVLNAALADVQGIDAGQAQADARGQDVREAIDRANEQASDEGVTDLPSYTLTRGEDGEPMQLDGSCQGCLARSLERALGGPEASPTPTPEPVEVDPKDAAKLGREVGEAAETPEPTVTPTVAATVSATSTP